MEKKLQEMSDAFRLQYEMFLNSCDANEELRNWDVIADGEMESYYLNDMMSIIVLLISADGSFSADEADMVNDLFGFRYTPEELADIYRTNGEDIRNMLQTEVSAGYKKMKALNSGLAEHYRIMLLQICDIISACDGVVHTAEKELIEKVRASLNQ